MKSKSKNRESSSLRVIILAALVFLAAISTGAQDSSLKLSSPEQIKEEFSSVPCEDKKRLEAVKSLFERAGAPSSDVTVDKYKDVENFVVTMKGESSEKIIIGAHYDKVADGCGAVDNWTGQYCAMINIDSFGLAAPQIAATCRAKS